MSEKLAKGHLFRIEMEVALPCEATPEEAEQWLEFMASQNGSIPNSNPLLSEPFEVWRHRLEIEDLGRIGTKVEFDHQTTESGGRKWRVRYEERPA